MLRRFYPVWPLGRLHTLTLPPHLQLCPLVDTDIERSTISADECHLVYKLAPGENGSPEEQAKSEEEGDTEEKEFSKEEAKSEQMEESFVQEQQEPLVTGKGANKDRKCVVLGMSALLACMAGRLAIGRLHWHSKDINTDESAIKLIVWTLLHSDVNGKFVYMKFYGCQHLLPGYG